MKKKYLYVIIVFGSGLVILAGFLFYFFVGAVFDDKYDTIESHDYNVAYVGKDFVINSITKDCPGFPVLLPQKIPVKSSTYIGFGVEATYYGCSGMYQLDFMDSSLVSGNTVFMSFIVDKKMNFHGYGKIFDQQSNITPIEKIQVGNNTLGSLFKLNEYAILSFPYGEFTINIRVNSYTPEISEKTKEWLIAAGQSILEIK